MGLYNISDDFDLYGQEGLKVYDQIAVKSSGLTPTLWWNPTGGNDSNDGTSKVNAKLTLASLDNVSSPGDVVAITNGTHDDIGSQTFTDDGTSGNPITFQAETDGSVTFTGTSRIVLDGDYLTFGQGIEFDQCEDTTTERRFRMITCSGSNIKVSNLKIRRTGDDTNDAYKTNPRWMIFCSSACADLEVSYCELDCSGGYFASFLYIHPSSTNAVVKYNYVHDAATPTYVTGQSFVLTGSDSGDYSTSTSATIHHNLVHDYYGNTSFLEFKSADNIVEHNVFNLTSEVNLRGGDDMIIRYNYFIGDGSSNQKGIRTLGSGHKIYANYFYKPYWTGDLRLFRLFSGDGTADKPPSTNIVIYHNTVIDFSATGSNKHLLALGTGGAQDCDNITIKNNIFSLLAGTCVQDFDGQTYTFADNSEYGADTACGGSVCPLSDPSELAQDADPSHTTATLNGWTIYILDNTADADILADGSNLAVEYDKDLPYGRTRPSTPDLGCHEYSDPTGAIDTNFYPVSESMVGITW